MRKKDVQFTVDVYESAEELLPVDAELVRASRSATGNAYAPYSKFQVSAVALLENGTLVKGTNQENASYPVGICAERVLLSCIASQHPAVPVKTIAISYHNLQGDSDHPVFPCGLCRQSLAEYEERLQQPIRLILAGMTGEVHVVESVRMLLPLSFGARDMS